MSCKSRWRKGDGNLAGTSGNDWMFGGRRNNTIDARDGNDFVRAGRGNDDVDGGAGSDRVYAGSGDDVGTYTVAENMGSKDYYNGGRGNDVLVLKMTHAEFESSQVQADLHAFDAFLVERGNSWWHHSFQFKAFDLKVKNWESYKIQFTDSEKASSNEAPHAVDDSLSFHADLTPIEEVEPNDPNQSLLSATAQVIERSSFHVAPSEDVGDDSLPRVTITGAIAGSLPVTGPNANDVDLFAITLQAGEKLILDIDYAFRPESQMNAQLFLMDESGKVLVEADDAPTSMGGTGSLSPRDPYLEFTDDGSGGTYYVAVSTWNNDPLGPSGKFNDFGFMPGEYVLNVSIDNPTPDLGAFVVTPDKLLANDFDADGESLVITNVGNGINGKVELINTGDILFKPGADSPGSFEYTVRDGNGGESTATVTVNGNRIVGTASDDVLAGTPEPDLFVGGDGSDTFNFSTGTGNDTIADFARGIDALAITDSMLVHDFQTLGNDTLVNFDTGDSVLLVGVSGVTDVNDLFV